MFKQKNARSAKYYCTGVISLCYRQNKYLLSRRYYYFLMFAAE